MKKASTDIGIMNNVKYSADLSSFSNPSLEMHKPRVLLHVCCGPCSTSCVERLVEDYSVTLYYYNPNITDREEYLLRKNTILQFLEMYNSENKDLYYVEFLEGEYDSEKFKLKADPLRNEPEGGRRCDICFAMRLTDTARMAKQLEFDFFTTTMSVSPHKNYEKIKTLGLILEEQYGVKYLDIDFKKKNGFGRSVEMSKEYGMYRQSFCGCDYARYNRTEKMW